MSRNWNIAITLLAYIQERWGDLNSDNFSCKTCCLLLSKIYI